MLAFFHVTTYQLFLITCVLCFIGDMLLHVSNHSDEEMARLKLTGLIFLFLGCATLTLLVLLAFSECI